MSGGGIFRGLRYVEMGVCWRSSQGRKKKTYTCALTEDDCFFHETYEGQIQDEKIMKDCNPNDVKIGRCIKENACALRATDCEVDQSSSNFQIPTSSTDDSTMCTLQRDKSIEWDIENPSYTQFGSCRDTISGDHFCIYNPRDCDESGTEVYATPAETLAAGVLCDCSSVHVWACRTSRHTFCAVNEYSFERDSCIPNSPHVQRLDRAKEVRSDGLDCRLCRRSNTGNPTPAPSHEFHPSSSPVTRPSFSPTSAQPSPSFAVIAHDDYHEKDVMTAALIGASTGAAIATFLVASVFFFWWKKFIQKELARKEAEKEEEEKRHKIPMREFSIPTGGGGSDDDLSPSFEVESAFTDDFIDHDKEEEEEEEENKSPSSTF